VGRAAGGLQGAPGGGFLRFLYTAGLTSCELSGVLPTVAVWGGGSLPKALEPEQVRALLESCDPGLVTGLRDLAVLKMLARLGLRAGEVAGLVLEDFGWRHGEVVVRGKGGRVDRMPVPVDVGEAITDYLRSGRPRVECRSVFVRVCAPTVGLGPVGVSGVVMRACERAGVPICGAHRLRHSAATAMLRSGGSLSEVGQVLRHRSGPATTSIYAKVDRASLRTVAQPWPGGAA
jgi:integrase/recombinase XerD